MKKILSPSDPHPETPFWHSFWHTIWKCIWHIYSEILFDILSGIYFDFLFGIYSDILRGKATREWLLLLVEYETILFGAYLKAYVIIYVCIYICHIPFKHTLTKQLFMEVNSNDLNRCPACPARPQRKNWRRPRVLQLQLAEKRETGWFQRRIF